MSAPDNTPAPIPLRPQPGPGVVHLWRTEFPKLAHWRARLAESLSPDERTRAGGFRQERDTERYILSRGMLRRILAVYLGLDPRHLEFTYNRHGKPGLSREHHGAGLWFNVSHTDVLCLCAVTGSGEIGIDVERVTRELDYSRVAGRLLSPGEYSAIRLLDRADQRAAFFRLWTCKEACLKATGQGLAISPQELDLSTTPDCGTRAVRLTGLGVAGEWDLVTLKPQPDHTAAIVAHGGIRDLVSYRAGDILPGQVHLDNAIADSRHPS